MAGDPATTIVGLAALGRAGAQLAQTAGELIEKLAEERRELTDDELALIQASRAQRDDEYDNFLRSIGVTPMTGDGETER